MHVFLYKDAELRLSHSCSVSQERLWGCRYSTMSCAESSQGRYPRLDILVDFDQSIQFWSSQFSPHELRITLLVYGFARLLMA